MKSLIRFFLLIFILSLLPVITSTAQEKQKSKKQNSSRWALQFETRSLLNIYAFEGGTISLKYLLNKHSAFRAGLTIRGDNTIEDGKGEVDSVYSRSEIRNLLLELSLQYLFNNRINRKLYLYYGGGPLISYSIIKEKVDYKRVYNQKYLREDKTFSAGLKFVIGTEWFFLNYMSLSGEYDFSAAYTSLKGKDLSQDNIIEKKGNGYYLNNDVKLGLTIYL